jgi:hypothetical protein
MSKAIMEVPDLQRIGMLAPGDVPDDAAWSAIGQRMWQIEEPRAQATGARPIAEDRVPPSMVLDAPSRALVAQLHDAGPAAQRATPDELARVIARLEQHIVADTAQNQFELRGRIRAYLISKQETDFTALNAWVYSVVFATPRSDPWLGLLPRTDFTGLPGDGVVMP